MKIKVSIAVFICIFILAGCQSKGKTTVNVSKASSTSIIQSQNNAAAGKSKDKKDDVKQVKTGMNSKLTDDQKSQINSKCNSVIHNINSSLKSLEDFKDINLSSIN